MDIKHERRIVFLVCLIGGARVLLFSAAFPFFSNIDEQAHFDLVCRYSHGDVPRRIEPFGAESAHLIAAFASPEFFLSPQSFPEGRFPDPAWDYPPALIAGILDAREHDIRSFSNHEAVQAPLYYALAGLWYDLGKCLGLEGGRLLYWVRALNAPLFAALVWLSYCISGAIYALRPTMRLGVPLILSFVPQDVFYSINNDALSPVICGMALYGLLKFLDPETLDVRGHVRTGVSLGAALLTKFSNLPLWPVALFTWLRGLTVADVARRKTIARRLALSAAIAGIPVGLWCARMYVQFGDLTGAAAKAESLGWTRKSMMAIWEHPLFSLAGLARFWNDLMSSFWQGELTWQGTRLAVPVADGFYALSSLVLVGVAAVGLWRAGNHLVPSERPAEALCLGNWLLSVVFLASISLAYDFGGSDYPSRDYPFMTSGRLIAGQLIPFLVLYVRGVDRLLAPWTGTKGRLAVLGSIAAVITSSEIVLTWRVFQSSYNWFHMP